MHRPKMTLSSKVVHKNPFYQVRKDEFIAADEKKRRYYSVITDPFVVVCALTPKRKGVYLVKSWRYPLKRYLWEFPKGWREKNETPLMAAKRELKEETGLTAKKWKKIGWFYLAPGISNQRGYVFMAERLQKDEKHKLDDEIVEYKEVSLSNLKKSIKQNKFLDSASIAAAHFLREHIKK